MPAMGVNNAVEIICDWFQEFQNRVDTEQYVEVDYSVEEAGAAGWLTTEGEYATVQVEGGKRYLVRVMEVLE